MRYPKTVFRDYIGNVTMEHRDGQHKSRCLWEKAKRARYTEPQIAKMLTDAYELGRKEAFEDVDLGVKKARKGFLNHER